ncbi:hypothetical protein Q3G72_022160 [Acer saccharum]|nr:hypothetical protein Q3G72_022160 [Acer saccharum]
MVMYPSIRQHQILAFDTMTLHIIKRMLKPVDYCDICAEARIIRLEIRLLSFNFSKGKFISYQISAHTTTTVSEMDKVEIKRLWFFDGEMVWQSSPDKPRTGLTVTATTFGKTLRFFALFSHVVGVDILDKFCVQLKLVITLSFPLDARLGFW